MIRQFRMTKGINAVIRDGNYPTDGHALYCLHSHHATSEFVLGTIHRVLICMVSIVSKINTSNNFNVKELPARAADTAHWSGPLVAAR